MFKLFLNTLFFTVSIPLTPIIAVLMGVALALVMMSLVIALVIRSRRSTRPVHRNEVKMVYEKGDGVIGGSNSPRQRSPDGRVTMPSIPTSSIDTEEQNPDVIPINDGKERYLNKIFNIICL